MDILSSTKRAHNFKDRTGEKHHYLTVMRHLGTNAQKSAIWECLCRCGNTVKMSAQRLAANDTKSCGCWNTEVTIKRNTTHGLSKKWKAEYSSWCKMKQRCYCRTDAAYRNYGARGITVCARWRNSFPNFYADMGPHPGIHYSLERLNNNGSYSPKNCIWADRKTQARNKRTTHFLTLNGEKQPLAYWTIKTGIKYPTILHRLSLGWSVKDALTRPIRTLVK